MQQVMAFGAERFPLDPKATFPQRVARSRVMLERALNLRTMIAFVGSGCSAPLGYPVWRTLVSDVVQETFDAGGWDDDARKRLTAFRTRLEDPTSVRTRNLIFYLGFCQSLLDQDSEGTFHKRIAERFARLSKNADRAAAHNPYDALMALPIERYITTNYDDELRRMLKQKPDVENPIVFTQETQHHGKLAGFAVVGIPELRNAIFHCHGRYEDETSIVASEADYQRWYLPQRDTAATTFRQSLDLLLNSNPVLFLGYGMEDDDLLRPLRAFRADNPERKSSRLLFALTEHDPDNMEQQDWMDSFHERYGINFITYEPPPSDDAIERGRALHEAILGLLTAWQDGIRRWTQKPVIRRARVAFAAGDNEKRPQSSYFHYSVDMSQEVDLAQDITTTDVATLRKYIDDKRTRIVVVTGDGGSGKSWRVLKLLHALKDDKDRRFTGGIFFWSSYYADDWLTGLDRALSYLENEDLSRPKERRLERFRRCLHSGEHLLVFDGFERLLRETDNPKLGRPSSQSVKELLEIMAEENDDTFSTVILTSRLMPKQLYELIENAKKPVEDGELAPAQEPADDTAPELNDKRYPGVVNFPVRRLTTQDLRAEVFSGVKEPADLARICSLCAGHSYALQLTARFLAADPGNLEVFRREISRRAPDSRNSEIIKLAIDAVNARTGKLGARLLERLAVFMSPIDDATLEICYQASIKEAQADAEKEAKQEKTPVESIDYETVHPQSRIVDELLHAKLLLRVQTDPQEPPKPGDRTIGWLTVHPIVRSHVFVRRHRVVTDAMPNFTLAGFTSGNAACHPGRKGADQIRNLFAMLCEAASDRNAEDSRRRSLVRAAFGAMRSRMESNTVARWTHYDEYIQHGLLLRYVTTELAGDDTWDYQDRPYALDHQSDNGILYPDELAWLYNDIGLALCSEGSMADAYSLWEQGFEIDRVTDSEEEGGQYIVQSHLHMSHLFIDLGRLPRAAQFLTTTERANALYQDIDFGGRIKGFRGLLAHLAGNIDEAEKLYATAITQLTSDGRRNLRAESVFHRHWADLLIHKRNRTDAEMHVELSLSLAREGNFPDLEAYARKTRAHLMREHEDRDPREARAEYDLVMERARAFGIKRLQADIHSELARLALDVGDWETARIRAMDSLMLANELSLGLRRTHALVILGRAMDAAGNKKLAVNYLQHAWSLAQLQGYYLRGREAEQVLLSLGAPTQPDAT
jgi:hypothetical protein